MTHHLIYEAGRYHGSGGGYALSLFFRWLWHEIGWWSMFIIGPLTGLGLWGMWSDSGEDQ